jgi:hypothetical protein
MSPLLLLLLLPTQPWLLLLPSGQGWSQGALLKGGACTQSRQQEQQQDMNSRMRCIGHNNAQTQ